MGVQAGQVDKDRGVAKDNLFDVACAVGVCLGGWRKPPAAIMSHIAA